MMAENMSFLCGVSDPKFGEEVACLVQMRPGVDVDEEALRAFCDGQNAHYIKPQYVKVVEEFPMTDTGKIQKFKMRELTEQELGEFRVNSSGR